MTLGIVKTKYIYPSSERISYRVRGVGAEYDAFYKWLLGKTLKRQWDDWPWSGFSFVNKADEDALETAWKSSMFSDDEDVVSEIEDIDPPEPTPSENEMFQILRQAIDDEVKKEMMKEAGSILASRSLGLGRTP